MDRTIEHAVVGRDIEPAWDGMVTHHAEQMARNARRFGTPLWLAREQFLAAYDTEAERLDVQLQQETE